MLELQKVKPLNLVFYFTLLLSLTLFNACDDDDSLTSVDDSEETSDDDVSGEVSNDDYTVGLIYKNDDAYDGYTLFYPIRSTTTYLINNCGELVQSWPSDYTPQAAYLLEDGNLLHTGTLDAVNSEFESAGGQTGRVELINYDGEVTWYYENNTDTSFMHHDVEYIESTGNVLVMVWVKHTIAETSAAGRTNATATWTEKILEIDPDNDEIVWQWDAWDHLIQDENADKENYGVVADNPQLIDINYICDDQEYEADWLHCNGVDYNASLDQIVISCRHFNEFWIIDHSTTTEEAAAHAGGTHGKGGDILYRWGNPESYDMGNENDRMLFLQHDANWIDDDYTDGGQIMVFNNQAGYYSSSNYSTVDVINTNVNSDGSYTIDSDGTYLPDDFTWTYKADTPSDFYSENISGARRLANGNTIICSGAEGTFFEVDYDGNVVWKYINPVDETGIVSQYDTPSRNYAFRCQRYAMDYPGLDAYDLSSQGTLESGSDYECSSTDDE